MVPSLAVPTTALVVRPSPQTVPEQPGRDAAVVLRTTEPAAQEGDLMRRVQDLLGAFGQALTIAQDRRANETLDIVLTAQHEQMALVVQGMAEQRHEYGAALERAVTRLTQEAAPESLINVGEVFQQSAEQITGALRRGEHLQGRMLEALRGIGQQLGELSQQVAALATPALAPATKASEPHADKPALSLVATGSGKPSRDSPLNRLSDNDDDDDDDT